jgi:glycosyltransferase involved in cell wall biosynthesis
MANKMVIKSAILRSNRIIAVSEFTKNDILKNYRRIPAEKIAVTYEACDDYCLFNPKSSDEIVARYGIKKPYILYVGNAYPHKNPERLIEAFQEVVSESSMHLVFVGGEDYFYERLKEFVSERGAKNIIFAGFIPDYDLDAVFRAAVAYIRPSLYEGFELPPLEAMTRGIPVLSSDHTCAKEILGDSVFYFPAEDTSKMAKAILKVAADGNLRKVLIERGYRQVKKYSWKNMAKQTLRLYESVK